MPTRLRPQPWPWPGPRVLLENPDERAGLASTSALRWAGFAVAVCPGPKGDGWCPLPRDDGCALVRGADVIVSSLGLARPEGREVLAALRARSPETPVLVEVGDEEAGEHADSLSGCTLLPSPVEPEQLVAAVVAAYAGKPGRSAVVSSG
jgi:DNA-binding response OmpR family regulator